MKQLNLKIKASGQAIGNKSFNKIFCIGYNKTGTTTLAATLCMYGYRLPKQKEQEFRLTKNVFETNYEEFKNFVSKYEAFQDMPFSQGMTFVAADALFPDSKFILSVRESNQWFDSLISFTQKKYGVNLIDINEKTVRQKFNYLYEGYDYENQKRLLTEFNGAESFQDWEKIFDRSYYIEQYERRNKFIKEYFINSPKKLLEIDVTKEATTERICEFLGVANEYIIEMPHKNKT